MKRLVLALMMVAMVVLVANATAPPAPPWGAGHEGWGMTWYNWDNVSGTFSSWGLYDPLYPPQQGAAWVVGWNPTAYITYAPITLELWIEMYAQQTYHYTSYQWHRLGNALEQINCIIEGTIQSNNGQYMSLTHGTDPLNFLYFRENVLGGTSPGASANIPILWYGRWGTGLIYEAGQVWPSSGWNPITPGQYGDPGDITMLIPDPCDHWFQFKATFEIAYHQADGYYSLTMAGCPAPVL